jgi:hypothetical protein
MEIDEICKRLRPLLGQGIDKLWSLYQISDPKGKQWVLVTLKNLMAAHLDETMKENKSC